MSTFSFSKNHQSVFKNGEEYFTSPIHNSNKGSLHTGLVLSDLSVLQNSREKEDRYKLPHYWGRVVSGTEVVVAGGGCCDGYIMSVTHKGKISKILAIDFNVRRITPIIHESNGVTRLGLLVSGAGCSGCGVRFVNFDGVTPTSTPVMTTDESKGLYDSWLRGKDPLGVEDIWERLEKIGVKVDQKRTMMAVEALVRF